MNLVVKVLLQCVIRFSISFRWHAFPKFCTQISRPLAYGVRISSRASATAVVSLTLQPYPPQEPHTDAEIKEFAEGYGVKFDMFSKIEVNGPNALPLYRFLKSQLKGTLGR